MSDTPKPATLISGFATSVPLILGYFPIAFSFGVAATRSGLTPVETFSLSLFIYAGAAQFLAIALIATGAPVLISVLTLVAMNLRHVLYGPTLMRKAGPGALRKWSWAWAFGLTDEVFGAALAALAGGKRFSEPFMFGLAIGAYGAWLSGTALGAYAGGGALERWPAVSAGLGFMLPALFLSLLLSIVTRAQLGVIAIAMAATVGVSLVYGGTAGLLSGMVAGAVAGVLGVGARDAG